MEVGGAAQRLQRELLRFAELATKVPNASIPWSQISVIIPTALTRRLTTSRTKSSLLGKSFRVVKNDLEFRIALALGRIIGVAAAENHAVGLKVD